MPTSRFMLNGNLSASNRIARQINRNLIFNQIRVKQPISRAELARTSGLQRSTVSLIVEELLADRWVVEGPTGEIPRGRKPIFLNVNVQRGVLALDIHPAHAMLAVTDLVGKIISLDSVQFPSRREDVIGVILNSAKKMLRTHSNRTFEGVGINLPGRFDPRIEKSIFAPNVVWPIWQLKSRVEKATGLPVVVDNVANACALSEVWFGYGGQMHDLVVVNVSEGIGTGIFANGHLLRGQAGAAGEFGHVQLDPQGLRCGCGSTGCWETIASNRAGMRYYAAIAKQPVPSFEILVQLAKVDDPAAKEALSMMCKALGRGMRMIALALAPGEIVIVGDITNVWDWAGPVIEAEMRRFALVRVPNIRPASEGNKARLRSAVALVMSSKML
jgi:predicted NBD/HSP70 family sugar kinase